MALISHSAQHVSYEAFRSRPISWSKEVQLKPIVTLQLVGPSDRSASWKQCSLCISSQNDESGYRAKGSKVRRSSVKLSDVPHKGEEIVMESTELQDSPLSCCAGKEETLGISPSIQRLFKKWLMLLHTHPSNQISDGIFGNGPPQSEKVESQITSQQQEKGKILKAVGRYFWGLDATIKIPLLIFIPLYMAVNVKYGVEVSKELTPLWILGPVVVALYIKMLRAICSLYVFTFKQTIKIAKNVPSYYLLAYSYISQGKLKEGLRKVLWQPVEDMKNMNYKEVSHSKLKEFQEWLVERFLDSREAIWPVYCRTLRFLKRAHLI